MTELSDLNLRMRAFAQDRDWEQFHDPKSLILALVGEVGELCELFQWVPADAARPAATSGRLHQRASEEMSDVLLYLLRLADVLGIDLVKAAHAKLDQAESRFPADDVRGYAPVKE